MNKVQLDPEIYRNFHLFWDNFPTPVMLVYKDRTILDRNKAAEAIGCVPGNRCSELGGKEAHQGCRANLALRERTAQRQVEYVKHMEMVIDSYWIPLVGYDDVYIHFGIDITEHAAKRYFPAEPGQG